MFLNQDAPERTRLVSDRSFKRNLHSMLSTYLRLKGEKGLRKTRRYYPVPYGASKRKVRRIA
ncbi:MAG: hypothetical protein JXQ30_03440 [Spirochaetes bacterium]|nr:hypothetical protein [Spirochaetota bacterium]